MFHQFGVAEKRQLGERVKLQAVIAFLCLLVNNLLELFMINFIESHFLDVLSSALGGHVSIMRVLRVLNFSQSDFKRTRNLFLNWNNWDRILLLVVVLNLFDHLGNFSRILYFLDRLGIVENMLGLRCLCKILGRHLNNRLNLLTMTYC